MLNEYIGNGHPWGLDRVHGGVHVLPPYESSSGKSWYEGTANAIYQNISFIDRYNPDYVAVLSGDHIYKMNYNKMLEFHKAHKADATIAVLEVPWEEAPRFGIMSADENDVIYEFAKVHLTSGAIGGFDVLQTVTLMAQAQGLPETAGIETHTGAKGFRNTPVWAEHLLTDTEKTTVFTGNAKQAIATFPRRVNVAVATSLATTGPEITGVTMHSVPGWVGDDHCITAEIEGVKAVVDICSSTSAIAGWSAVSLLRNLASPVCFY